MSMVGKGGGNFYVLAMVAATALMGFIGHSIHGDFNPKLAIPLTIVAAIGEIVGSKYAVKSKPKNLKKIFVLTNLIVNPYKTILLIWI